MRAFVAVLRKELTEQTRAGKLTVLGILFVLLGILNPAFAKMTPWLLEVMADSLAESGMITTGVTVTALDSWVQFFKNLPIALGAFVLMEGSILTGEYSSGTLLLSLTKGLARCKVILAKTAVLVLLWTLGFWICFAITYGYNAYFWDNAIAQNLGLAALCWWGFGLLTVSLMTLFSTLADSQTGVLLGTGGVVLGCYLLGFLPRVGRYLPTALTGGRALIYGTTEAGELLPALILAAVSCLACLALSIPILNKKQL